MLKLKLSTLAISCEELTHWKRLWCWEWRWWNSRWAISNHERWCCESAALNMPANLELGGIRGRRRRGRPRMRGLDGITNSMDVESEWTPGVGDGQGGLACCDSWGLKESDRTEGLNWTEATVMKILTMPESLRCISHFFLGDLIASFHLITLRINCGKCIPIIG